MMLLVIHLLLLTVVYGVSSLRVSCHYTQTSPDSPTLDECVAMNLTVLDENEAKVTSVSGDVTKGILDYTAIVSLRIISSPHMSFMPQGFDKFFKNLQHLDITECGLKQLSRRDVEVFPLLKRLTLRGTQLEHFDFNILSGNREIEYVDLSGNNLKRIDTKSTQRLLAHLTFIDVSGNSSSCVTGSARGRDEVMKLMRKIYEHCSDGFGSVKFAAFTVLGCLIALVLLLIMYHCLKGLLGQ